MGKCANCPVCSAAMNRLDVPQELYSCKLCDTIAQVLDNGTVCPINILLEKNNLGDDRIRAAMSLPHVSTMESFVETYDAATRFFQRDMATSVAGLKTVLVQIENRINVGISKLSDLALVDETAQEAVLALTEAREMVSTMPKATRGIPDDDKNKVHRAEG